MHLPARSRRGLLALVSALAFVLSLVALPALPATAETQSLWAPTRTPSESVNGVQSGLGGTPRLTYDLDLRDPATGRGSGVPLSTWEFTTSTPAIDPGDEEYYPVEGEDGGLRVPYTWQGLHAWAGVTARLEMVVEDAGGVMQPVGPPLYAPPSQSCCTTPSNGFITGGVADFGNVPAGRAYGFRLSGSNGDYSSFLRGTLTLSTQPYLESLGGDNRQWTNPQLLGTTSPGASGNEVSDTGTLTEPGEARWWRFRVIPGQQVSVTLRNLPADYDLALYGDIHAAFDALGGGTTALDLTKLAAATSGTTPGNQSQVPSYAADPDDPNAVTNVPTKANAGVGAQFAPRVYAPRVYAPRVYAPRVYAPRVYAPRVYAPRVYAPSDGYRPELTGSDNFRDAFAAAQSQTLLAISANSGTGQETVSAATGDTDGWFYVRVQGHDDKVFDKSAPFTLSRRIVSDQGCAGVDPYEPGNLADWTPPTETTDQSTVIVTDTSRLSLSGQDRSDYLATLGALARRTDGVVADLADVPAVEELHEQADESFTCAYASNLVAGAAKDVVDHFRGDRTRYVVIAGGDDVVPFFRYPDLSGFGSEDQFELKDDLNGQAGTSLDDNQVLSQDAYGASTELTIGGSTVPVPDLAVGRLLKTPDEITSAVEHYLVPDEGTVIRPGKSLVTGYDFLADAADAVQVQLREGMGVPDSDETSADSLIEAFGTPHGDSWTGRQLAGKVLARHNDVMFLAGHFSANDTLAADFTTGFEADELAQGDGTPVRDPGASRPLLSDTLVVSPGCHSGYGIVEKSAEGDTNTADWAQRMAQHHAVLVAGTGYQYGDTDFLEYSERLYLGFFKQLRAANADDTGAVTPVATGEALVRAKQDYLATLATMTGIDQKAVLQATLYGLPMVGVDFAERNAETPSTSKASPTKVEDDDFPGAGLGLQTDDLAIDTGLEAHHKEATASSPRLSWFEGPDGVTALPGAPVLPKQVVNVSAPGSTLRGVGFRSGTYAQESGLHPLTGAPAIEGTTPHTTFFSSAWFPQQMFSTNYFDTLGDKGTRGRTSLVVSPTQWRSDSAGPDVPVAEATNTVRAYSDLGVRLFYSSNPFLGLGATNPALAAAPGITDVSGTAQGRTVSFSMRAAGDPSAGVQEAWVTWTSGPNSNGVGRWESVDLVQDVNDSTRWTGTLTLPESVDPTTVRFVAQAVNGIGAVGLDTAEGNGHAVTDVRTGGAVLALTSGVLRPHASTVGARVTDGAGSPLVDRPVRLRLVQGGATVVDEVVPTDETGAAPLVLPAGVSLQLGDARLVADLLQPGGTAPLDTVEQTLQVQDPARPTLAVAPRVTQAAPGITATVTDVDTGTLIAGRSVQFTLRRGDDVLMTTTAPATDGLATFVPSGPLPTGQVTLRAKVVGQTTAWSSQEQLVEIPQDVLTVPASLTTVAGSAFPTMTATLKDANGAVVKGAPVTFTLPSSGTVASFDGGARTATVLTNQLGVATAPRITSRGLGGLTSLEVSAPRAESRTVPLRASFPLSAFVSPVLKSGVTSANLGSNVPVKVSALQASGARVTDAIGAALASHRQVVLTWAPLGTSAWRGRAAATYVPDKDFFQIDLKATSAAGFARKGLYTVRVSVLPSFSSPLADELGFKEFTLKIG